MTAPVFDGTQPCAGADLELFFPTRSSNARQLIAQAKAICARCPFQPPCLEYALWTQATQGRYVDGVWGGTTDAERTRIRQARRAAAA